MKQYLPNPQSSKFVYILLRLSTPPRHNRAIGNASSRANGTDLGKDIFKLSVADHAVRGKVFQEIPAPEVLRSVLQESSG